MSTPPDAPLADPREAKLPVWAQIQLREMRRLVSQWERYAIDARLETRPEETDTVVDDYSQHPIGLPKGEPVKFRRIERAGRREEYITARMLNGPTNRGWVCIQGADVLEILPQSGNTILVRSKPWVSSV